MRFLILLLSLLFIACGEVGDSGAQLPDEEQELRYNYQLLKAYFFHPERIKEYSAYRGMKVDDMYEDLKDYFCGAGYTGNCWARYTFYTVPEEADKKIDQIENTPKYYSFGFERTVIQKEGSPDTLRVSAVYPISPASAAGLKKGDKLLLANDVPLTGENAVIYLNTDSLFETLTRFTVLRDEQSMALQNMQKAEVQRPTVFLDSLEEIPFIRVTEYKVSTNNPNGTYAEFKDVLQKIKGTRTAIMDLRGNPGGNIGHCTAMAAELVPLNSELVYDVEHYYDKQRGNVIDSIHYFARDYLGSKGAGTDINWIILMNRGSASCSERFTAAVKYNRPETIIIGGTSYGKGVGQIYTKTYLGGLAYITFLQSFYPNGETFHNIGIAPTVPIESGDDAIYYAAVNAAQNFGLAKRLPTSIQLKKLPPEHKAESTEPSMYKKGLFHQWE